MRSALLAFGAGLLLILAAIFFVDVPVARFIHTLPWAQDLRSPALGLPVLVVFSGAAILFGAVQVSTHHTLRKLQEVLIVASFSLASAVCIDELVLKRLFGRETPDEFLFQGGTGAFHWFQGTPYNSFPSGHATQIVSVGTVLLIAYPRQRPVWLFLMGLVLIALVLGNWHFVSDVLAGAGWGMIVGIATTVLWHSRSPWQTSSRADSPPN